uniref:Mutator-like transposase domain-containing protein n=1 Tax=Magallana gigas TaxID=29159 RepID=K1Q499_MAGGI
MAAPFEKTRDKKGRFVANKKKRVVSVPRYVRNEHSYTSANISRTDQPEHAEGDDNWKEGRRIVEFGVLLSNLRHCEACRLGPVALTYDSVVGELQKGLGGYLYVKCSNKDCNHVNRVPYGSTHRVKKLGMPCFAVNTKLGTAMIDSLGGPDRVNNVLAALNLKPISQKNLKMIERRAGNFVESIAKSSMSKAAKDSFELQMEDVGNEESKKAQEEMGEEIDGLGVNEKAGLSPGKFTKKYAAKQLKHRLQAEERSKLPSTKRRRIQLKQERNNTQCAFQALEGDTYQSEIGLEDEVDIVQIPDPVPRGVFKPITLSSGSPSLVVFDLETTDLKLSIGSLDYGDQSCDRPRVPSLEPNTGMGT